MVYLKGNDALLEIGMVVNRVQHLDLLVQGQSAGGGEDPVSEEGRARQQRWRGW